MILLEHTQINKEQETQIKRELIQIDYHNIKKASFILRALNHKLRHPVKLYRGHKI